MSKEKTIAYKLLLKPSGGLLLLLEDPRMLVDIDLDEVELRDLAMDLLELADRVAKMPRGLPHPKALARWPQ